MPASHAGDHRSKAGQGPGNWSTGTIPGVNDDVIIGDLNLAPGSQLRIRNALMLVGTVRVDGAAISFAGDQTFGLGSILFTDNFGFLDIEANTTLTLGPAMVVRGRNASVRQGGGTTRLINQGLISPDVTGGTTEL